MLCAGLLASVSSAAEPLLVSSAPDRSGAQQLDGTSHAHGTRIYVFTRSDSDVRRVRFYLDDPAMSGSPRKTEVVSPYDFNGTADDDSAMGFDVSELAAGSHTIMAAQDTVQGSTRVLSATFTVTASAIGQREMLAVSSQRSRSGAQPLAGSVHSQSSTIYVFTTPSTDVRRVRFYLDDPEMRGTARRTEYVAPYDFNGTADDDSALGFDVATLSAGSHTITAAQDTSDGRTRALSATFEVRASSRTLLFEDNFDGTGVNTSNWDQYYSPGHDGNGLRRPSAFSVSGGNLVITAQMLSGQLVSGGMALRRNYTYGRIEFRARADVDPTGTMNGNVLTWPQSNNWPTDGEMNIWETGWRAGTRRPFHTFIHYSPFNRQYYYTHDADASQWHTMALEWTASSLKVFRDGALVWTLTDAAAIPDVPHHVCIQLDAMERRSLTGPVRMYVDYVRIYR